MEPFRRRRVLIVAAIVALAAGAAWGQPLEAARSPLWAGIETGRIQALYRAFEAGFESHRGFRIEFIQAALRATDGSGQPGEAPSTCVRLTGTGGNPRIDGGGDPLAAMPHDPPLSFARPANVYRIGAALHDDGAPSEGVAPLVVIDAFDLDMLTRSMPIDASLTGGDLGTLWDALVDPGNVPHGHLVLFHLLGALVEEVGQVRIAAFSYHADEGVLDLIVGQDAVPATVTLHHVSFDDVDALSAAVEAARRMDGAVVVTSWGLVDCTLAARYEGSAGQAGYEEVGDFATYVLHALREAGTAGDLLQQLCSVFEPEIAAFFGLASVDCGQEDVLAEAAAIVTVAVFAATSAEANAALRWHTDTTATFFASAGNQGLPFPMPPAAWPGVVGVEACAAPGGGRSAFSNAGSTGAPGASSALALGAWFEAHEVGPEPLGYWGTSFAAPAAAARFATGAWDMGRYGHVALRPCGG